MNEGDEGNEGASKGRACFSPRRQNQAFSGWWPKRGQMTFPERSLREHHLASFLFAI